MKRRVLIVACVFWLAIVDLGARGPWITFDGCQLVPNPSNDGDSFHVRAKNKEYIFRLYFADTPETDAELPERVQEQAKYFGLNKKQTVEVGLAAKMFTREKLAAPFTVRTCMEDALGRSKMERFYAFVQAKDGGDLGEQLIENGLARVHGASATPVGLSTARAEWQKLEGLERQAKLLKVGGWGVASGRLNARVPRKQKEDTASSFDAFFHPDRLAPKGTPLPQPTPVATPIAAPTIARSTSTPAPPAATQSPDSKLDVNIATEEQLVHIPGIGPTLAARIIANRPYKSADGLRKVKGIGDTRYEKLRPYFN
jgi:DNA uptake protein ComE-like DNA-binding protein